MRTDTSVKVHLEKSAKIPLRALCGNTGSLGESLHRYSAETAETAPVKVHLVRNVAKIRLGRCAPGKVTAYCRVNERLCIAATY